MADPRGALIIGASRGLGLVRADLEQGRHVIGAAPLDVLFMSAIA